MASLYQTLNPAAASRINFGRVSLTSFRETSGGFLIGAGKPGSSSLLVSAPEINSPLRREEDEEPVPIRVKDLRGSSGRSDPPPTSR